jgi:hypothetical protein
MAHFRGVGKGGCKLRRRPERYENLRRTHQALLAN